jgi:hypothetical protein
MGAGMAGRLVIVLSFLAMPCIVEAAPFEVPVVTVCDILQNASAYNGHVVIVVGRYGGTDEGAWLDADCPQEFVQNGIERHASIALTDVMEQKDPPSLPHRFRWNQALLSKRVSALIPSTVLHSVPRLHYRDRWAAIFGRFETRPLLSKRDGFGHMAGSPARLIWQARGIHIFHVKSEHWVVSKD